MLFSARKEAFEIGHEPLEEARTRQLALIFTTSSLHVLYFLRAFIFLYLGTQLYLVKTTHQLNSQTLHHNPIKYRQHPDPPKRERPDYRKQLSKTKYKSLPPTWSK